MAYYTVCMRGVSLPYIEDIRSIEELPKSE